ncbi:MAG: hypothetical protein CL917_11405 [Deltaproteobacteria bacterium]|nr:hypothetical protein [Deltaproteobacteria bacterium]
MAIGNRIRTGTVIAFLIAAFTGFTGTASAVIQAHVDQPEVRTGESFQLTIRSQGRGLRAEPDLSVLDRDFYVLSRGQSIRTTIVNGQSHATVDWQIQLAPIRSGDLEIPPILVGKERTKSIRLSVTDQRKENDPQNTHSKKIHQTIQLNAEIDRSDPYVQEQMELTLRLESSLPILSGSLTEPEVSGAIVEKLGEDMSQIIEVEGDPVHIFERRFAVFPQQSGEITINPSVFEGKVKAAPQGRNRRNAAYADSRIQGMLGGSLLNDFFGNRNSLLDDFFGQSGKSIRAISNPIEVTVRERPEQALGQRWLPAQDLALVEAWGDGVSDIPTFKVGEPIDRIIAIRARGVTSSQLPIPESSDVDGLKQYTQPDYEDTQHLNGEMFSVRALPTVLIPTREGHLTLPSIDVEWWDTETDQARVATLPARTVQVHPGEQSNAQSEPLPMATAPSPPQNPMSQNKAEPTESEMAVTHPGTSVWTSFWVIVVTLIAVIVFWKTYSSDKPRTSNFLTRNLEHKQLKRKLRHACSSSDPIAAESTLLEIASLKWPERAPRSTAEILQHIGTSEMACELKALAASRYAKTTSEEWNGDELWEAFRRSTLARTGKLRKTHSTKHSLLPDLYPSEQSAS